MGATPAASHASAGHCELKLPRGCGQAQAALSPQRAPIGASTAGAWLPAQKCTAGCAPARWLGWSPLRSRQLRKRGGACWGWLERPR